MLLAKALFSSTRTACGFFRIEKSDMLFSETYRFQVFAYDILRLAVSPSGHPEVGLFIKIFPNVIHIKNENPDLVKTLVFPIYRPLSPIYLFCKKVAGVLGFEPRDNGVRVRCLTAWRYPSENHEIYYNSFAL